MVSGEGRLSSSEGIGELTEDVKLEILEGAGHDEGEVCWRGCYLQTAPSLGVVAFFALGALIFQAVKTVCSRAFLAEGRRIRDVVGERPMRTHYAAVLLLFRNITSDRRPRAGYLVGSAVGRES